MSPTAASRPARPQNRPLLPPDRLLAAATSAFAELGFHGTTTRDIAAATGLSPAALYVHFPSKQELLFRIMRDAHATLLVEMREAASGTTNATSRFAALVKAHVRFHAQHAMAARVANHELPALSAARQRIVVGLRREIEQMVDETLKSGVTTGEFSVRDVRRTTFFVLSAGIGVSRWFTPGGQLSPDEVAEEYAELLEAAVGARQDRRVRGRAAAGRTMP